MNIKAWAYCYCCSAEFALWEELHIHMAKADHSMLKHIGEPYHTPCADPTHSSL